MPTAFRLYTRLHLAFDERSQANMKYFIPFYLSIVCVVHALAAESKIIAAGATLQKLAGDFLFTEGPASDREGNVYFTDQPNDRILKWSIEGKLSTFMQPCGRANGLSFDTRATSGPAPMKRTNCGALIPPARLRWS